jgi:hypothetical protein
MPQKNIKALVRLMIRIVTHGKSPKFHVTPVRRHDEIATSSARIFRRGSGQRKQ